MKPEQLWARLQDDRWIVWMLATFTGLALAPLWLPQAPDTAVASAELLQAWLSTWSSLAALDWLARLGVFTLYRSLWLKLPLAWTVGLLLVRWADLVATWPRLTVRRRVARLGLGLGMLFLFSAGLLQWTSSHIYTDVQAWPDELFNLPAELRTAPPGSGLAWQEGLLFIPRRNGVGVQVEARAADGTLLRLLTSPQDQGQTHLRFALTPQSPEAYCALPEAGLVIRMVLGADPLQDLEVQVYRQSSGQLISSLKVRRSAHVFTEQAMLNLNRVDIQYMDVISYPGWPWFVGGMLCLALGGLSTCALPKPFNLVHGRRI